MRAKYTKGVQVIDQGGTVVGVVEDVDFKGDGTYAIIVRGEMDPAQARSFEKSLGASIGKDFFEIRQAHIGGIGDKVVLNTRFEDIIDLKPSGL